MSRNKEQVRKAVFGKLRGLRRRLHAQGVSCVHSRSALTGDNGDVALPPQVSIRTAEGAQDFDYLNFGQGIARIRQLFQAENGVTTSDIHK